MSDSMRSIPVDAALEDWLIERLRADPPESGTAAQLLSGVTDLKTGRLHALVLGRDGPGIPQSPPGTITAGKLQIFLKSRRVLMDSREISLTPKEFDILYFLAENRGEVFTKEQIYKAVWSEEYLLDDSNIMAFIRKLRKKIEPDPDAPRYILTIWGIGYKFSDTL